jgi:hypothetical protein
MTRRGKLFARLLGVLAAAVLISAPLAAQQTTGKIEGTVTDQAGTAIANAQVLLVGTSFGATTNEQGYYFINNVPVGSYAVRAQFIGYAPAEVRGVRILGGQTVTANVRMESSAVQVQGVTISAYQNVLVPRDQVASKSLISGDLVDNLPVDDVRQIIAVQPGVVESGASGGLSIRGGRPGEANVYIDGAPVRSTNSGSQALTLGTNAVEEASVTTGALGVEFADAQSGVISYTTRAGGSNYAGSFSYLTDEPFGDLSVGLNRFEASFGGPVPSVRNLTFFLSSVIEGQASAFRGIGYEDFPRYVTGGLDTTVTFVNSSGTTETVAIPQFVQFTGDCPSGSDAANAARDAILNNYGVECQGRRFPMDWTSDMKFQGKLQYSYGDGSRIFLSGVAQGVQSRNQPGNNIANPALFSGTHNSDRFLALDMNHVVSRAAERALSFNVNLSWQRSANAAGPLDPVYEAGSRSPFLGLEWGTMEFAGFEGLPSPVSEEIIRNIRTNNRNGITTTLLGRESELGNSQTQRLNPYGFQSGWPTGGFGAGGTLLQETRYTGRATVDWQLNRYNRIQLGGDIVKTNLNYWSSNFLNQFGMDAYVVDPVKYGLYAADRLDLGDVVLELGVRYDYYNANSLFATTPSRIFSHPDFEANYGQAATNDAQYAAFLADPDIWTPSQGHSSVSPRLRVSFPVTENTGFRLSYSHQVQSPEFTTLLTGINNDASFTNTNDVFGRDLQFGKTILFEFGVRHAFSQDMVLDISAYNKDKASDPAARIVPYADPLNPGDTINVNVLTNADFGNVRGIDMKLDRRVGNYVNATVGYTFQLSRSTGSDPFSYLRTTSRQLSQVTNDRLPPPQATLPTDDNRTHNLVGSVGLNLPDDWRRGTTAGNLFRNVSAFLTFRVVSGLPYTRMKNDGTGITAPRQNLGLSANTAEPLNASTLPWQRFVDLRLTKGLRLGRSDVTVFADLRNLLNFKNITGLYAETGDVVNARHRESTLASEYDRLRIEAGDNGRLLANNDIDLTPNCASWQGGSVAGVNCVMLRRAEARFGNGDGLYTVSEQERAFNTFYDAINGPQRFYGAGRHIRIGFELSLQ